MGLSIPDPFAALDEARGIFERSQDLTLAIEEEFQIVDPETHDLVNRFTELKARADATPLGEHTAGELIASEIEIKTGRCETFPEAARALLERRRALLDEADAIGVALAACGTHPWSPWWEQEIIDTPHYRIVEGTLRYVAWRNNTFGIHIHVGVRDADRAIALNNAMRSVLPDLLALSASSPWYEGRYTHLHSTRTQLFTRMFPRCGIPEPFDGWADYDALRALARRDELDQGAHRDLVVRAPASVVRHGRAAQRRRARRRARVARRHGLRLRALGAPPARDRRGRAAARPARPPHRGEHVARDPLGPLRRADRLRARHGIGARGAARARAARRRRARDRGARARALPRAAPPHARERQLRAALDRGARGRRRRSRELFADQVRVTRESVDAALAQETARG